MPLTPPNIVITGWQCCGFSLRNMGGPAIDEAYISEDSSVNPYAPDYNPFINETDDEQYYVTEDFNPDNTMPPRKHSEDEIAPDINAMSLFIGIQDNGDETFTNFSFTPAQLIAYVADKNTLKFTVPDDGSSFECVDIDGRPVKAMIADRTPYQIDEDFSQGGAGDNTITGTNISFYSGQKVTLLF